MSKPMELIKLIQENPELPIVPMVDGSIAEDDCRYWLGAWGKVEVDEYIVTSEMVIFKSEDDVFIALQYAMPEEYESLPDTESECRPYYEALPWQKAIIVYINAVEEEGK